MPDDLDSFDVPTVGPSSRLSGLGPPHPDKHKKGGQHPEQQPKDSKNFMHTIGKAAESSNEKLVRLNLPYRFSVYAEGDELFIDVVVLDATGKVINERKKNISHQDFERLIEDVSQIEGVFVDLTA
jgi:hypothetical protein